MKRTKSQFIHELTLTIMRNYTTILWWETIQRYYYEKLYNDTMMRNNTFITQVHTLHIQVYYNMNVIHCIGACLHCHGPSCNQNLLEGERGFAYRSILDWLSYTLLLATVGPAGLRVPNVISFDDLHCRVHSW